jgi:DNA modification methylase
MVANLMKCPATNGVSTNPFVNKVFPCDALDLLARMPAQSIDACIADPMYGTVSNIKCKPGGPSDYDWGYDPAQGDPVKHWQYHQPIYRECIRILRPGGILAWAQGIKFLEHVQEWFGGHRTWLIGRRPRRQKFVSAHLWVVQTREREPVEMPSYDPIIIYDRLHPGKGKAHPCPKPVEELAYMIEALTKPGDIILDCFCGIGSTLLAAEQLGRLWIGCDKSPNYVRRTKWRLLQLGIRR